MANISPTIALRSMVSGGEPVEYIISGERLNGGTGPIVLINMTNGNKFVLKAPLDVPKRHLVLRNAHEANEYLAFQLYKAAGCRVPDYIDFVQIVGTDVYGILENFIDGVTLYDLMSRRDPNIPELTFPAIRNDLIIHALFANWDINVTQNIMISYIVNENGSATYDYSNPITIDCGGTLQFRAMGGIKDFTPEVLNINSIIRYSTHYKPMGAFKSFSRNDLNKEICKRWSTVNKDAILRAFDEAKDIIRPHFSDAKLNIDNLRDILTMRMSYFDRICSGNNRNKGGGNERRRKTRRCSRIRK
jgi:hypothetical protein